MTTSRDHRQHVCRKPTCLKVVVVLVMAICFTRNVAAQSNSTTTSSGNDSSTQPPDNTTTNANNNNAPDPTQTVSGEVNTTTGDDTATAGNMCQNDTCGAHGTCNDTSGHAMCVCEEGWTGTNCTDDLDECTLGVCQNELYCENRVGGYSCYCLTGWQGDNCTEDIDECTLDPCPDPKANCSNTNGSFTCVCHHGYERLAPNTNCTEQVLLPYNTSGAKRDHGDDQMFGPFPIPYGFQLDGQTVLNYYVSINGYITFNTRFFSPRMPDVTSPQLSPLSFIAPYWADIHIPGGSATSGLYHVTLSLEDTYDNNETRAEFERYTDMAALGDDFHPVFIAVITWVDVRPYNASDFTQMQGATFQVMLATDGRRMTSRLAWRTVWPDSDQLHVTAWTHLTDSTKQDFMPLTDLPRKQTVTSSSDPGNSSAAQCIDWRHKQGRSLPRGPPRVACPCSLEQAKRDGLFQVNETSRCATSNVYDATTGMKQVCCYSADTDMIVTDPFSAPPPVLMTSEQNAAIRDGHSKCCVSGAPMMCADFHELFPLDTCATYSAPATALLWGDPHLVTLDGAQYTLNGWGEYDVLTPPAITNRSLHVQGRTDKLQDANVTVFTAFAFKYNDTVLQVHHMGNKSLTVYVSGEVMTPGSGFDSAAWGDVHVELTTSSLDVVFPTRVAVRITAMLDRLSLTFSAHMATLRQSLGLLGFVDGDVTNDYQLRNGTTLNASGLTPDSVFHFGQSWLIQNETASIFHYNLNGTGDNFTSNQHPEFTPLLLPLTREALLSKLNQTGLLAVGEALCDVSTACLHDLLATRNNVTAMETRDTQRLANRTAVILGQKPPQFVDQPALWNVTLTSAVFRHNIIVTAEDSNNTTYPDVSADVTTTGIDVNYTLSPKESGTWELVWYLSEDVRHLTTLTFRFEAVSSVTNMTSYYTPDIVLCACVREEECDYLVSSQALSATNGSGMFYVAGCQCGPDRGGRFCQDDVSICDECYDNSTCDAGVTQGNVCTKCPDGFLGDGVKCYEVDECRQTPPCDQQCANTLGSFNCSCYVGFTLVNATSCQDVNECTAHLDKCSTNGNEFCMNTEGGFECVCRPGFGGDTCTKKVSHVYGGQLVFLALAEKDQGWSADLNNIHTPDFKQLASKVQHVVSILLSNQTIPHVSVVVMAFELVSSNRRRRSNDGGTAQRIKAQFQVSFNRTVPVTSLEAALTSGFDPQCVEPCPFGLDLSTPSAMLYGVSRQDSRFDASYDLCGSDRNNQCHDDSTVCATEDGAAICRCRHGYQAWDLYDYACQDINECQTNTTQQLCGLTEPNSTECLNTVGSYYCTCPKTHRWDAATMRCAQLSSVCEANSSPCLNGGQCVTTTDSMGYTCRCKDGWSGMDCGDEDEEAKKLKTTLIIVGSVLGGVCLLLLVAVLAMCFVRSRRRTHSKAWRPSYDNGGAIPRPHVRSSGANNGSDPDYSNPMQRQDSMHKYTDFRGRDPDVDNGASRDSRRSGAQQYTNPVFTRDEDNSKL